jgi:hypothetical protein
MAGEYGPEVRRVVFGEGMTFVPVCEQCSRFVKADEEVFTDAWGQPCKPNAKCKKCGPTFMLFEGYY